MNRRLTGHIPASLVIPLPAMAALLLCLAVPEAKAAGTAAGTIISNAATVDYMQEGQTKKQTSNVNRIKVDDKVTFVLTPSDTTGVTITPGGKAYMTYILSNNGNAPHDFTLNAVVTGTPDFSPASGPLFCADTACTSPLPTDPGAGGLPYVSNLAPDRSKTIYMQVTAPAQLADGKTLKYLVTAEAYQSANLGAVNPPVKSSAQAAIDAPANKGRNPMNRYVILADGHGNGGDLNRDGKYSVIARDGNDSPIGFRASSATVSVVKSVTVIDRSGGNRPYSGATLHYALSVSAAGSGTAKGVVITDQIPPNTTYAPGTLNLNGVPLTDGADSDAGDVGGTTPDTVSVKIGEMTVATPAQVITFDVKIN